MGCGPAPQAPAPRPGLSPSSRAPQGPMAAPQGRGNGAPHPAAPHTGTQDAQGSPLPSPAMSPCRLTGSVPSLLPLKNPPVPARPDPAPAPCDQRFHPPTPCPGALALPRAPAPSRPWVWVDTRPSKWLITPQTSPMPPKQGVPPASALPRAGKGKREQPGPGQAPSVTGHPSRQHPQPGLVGALGLLCGVSAVQRVLCKGDSGCCEWGDAMGAVEGRSGAGGVGSGCWGGFRVLGGGASECRWGSGCCAGWGGVAAVQGVRVGL